MARAQEIRGHSSGGRSGKEVESSCEDLWTTHGVTLIPKAVGTITGL